jgi:hypothetical protein
VFDELAKPTDRTCHHGPAVGHRFGTRDPETLPARGAHHDRGAVVEAGELVAWHESQGIRHFGAKGAIAGYDESKPCSSRQEVLDALLL